MESEYLVSFILGIFSGAKSACRYVFGTRVEEDDSTTFGVLFWGGGDVVRTFLYEMCTCGVLCQVFSLYVQKLT